MAKKVSTVAWMKDSLETSTSARSTARHLTKKMRKTLCGRVIPPNAFAVTAGESAPACRQCYHKAEKEGFEIQEGVLHG